MQSFRVGTHIYDYRALLHTRDYARQQTSPEETDLRNYNQALHPFEDPLTTLREAHSSLIPRPVGKGSHQVWFSEACPAKSRTTPNHPDHAHHQILYPSLLRTFDYCICFGTEALKSGDPVPAVESHPRKYHIATQRSVFT